ncbi:uncharacterized protein ACHE_10902A [Aspergillus chevalieri]|uniref:Xylanolytic transcriptional activator regulatory domain-containing protein n=1 Tax=Aspergillus chevalieri TaxID=182096 RepID=A0A7R7VET8_ASPCH|nr:uncharacterized protein ACHE_10902A [Aspergillus chevalieri]BCR83500.1 hypothetical protein ACHE_10902A [Aspergillus chevalieri]
MPWARSTSNFSDFALFIDSMSTPYGNNPSMICFDQPILNLSPTPLFGALNSQPSQAQWQDPAAVSSDPVMVRTSESHLFDEFTSTFPSFKPSQSAKSTRQEPWKFTQQDWNHFWAEIQVFMPVLPPGFFLPSRHTMTRYVATYFSGFHRHLPFLHLPTFSPTKCPVDLLLAMASIGAQSAFDHNNAVMFFKASFGIVQERLRYRKAERCERAFPTEDRLSTESQPNEFPPERSHIQELQAGLTVNQNRNDRFDMVPLAQTLLVLMAMATWGNSKAIFNEAVGLRNSLACYIREERLLDPQAPEDTTWHLWIQAEGFKRTIAIIFCFFIFHTIVYDTPPPILNSELKIHLPSREKDWETQSEIEWQKARQESEPEPHFQSSFSLLFSKQGDEDPEECSSLGGYILILALIQHIYFLRETSKYNFGSDRSLSPTDVTNVEQALRNWQSKWYRDPESFLGPGSPQGPISFNSTALLRMAYIRLNVDVGPWRALDTHNPREIATSIYRSPHLTSNHRLTRAVLYSAHALSIPIKIGVNIVARNQAFAWSLQHSLCALECAFVISKWLIDVQPRASGAALNEDEARLLVYITDMVTEADAGGGGGPYGSDLCTRVIKIWAKLLSGDAVWDVVRMIGKALDAYGQILEQGPAMPCREGFDPARMPT